MNEMCNGIIYDPKKIDTGSVELLIMASSGGAEVSFEDEEFTADRYWLQFKSLEGWDKDLRYCYGSWMEEGE